MLKKLLNPLKNKRYVSENNGFTLVEFLIVLAAIGIVTGAALAVFKPIFGKSRVSAAVSSINNLKANAMVFASDNMDSFSNISINGTSPSMTSESILGTNWTLGSYAGETSSIQCSSTTAHCDPWGYTYYIAPGSINPTSTFTISLAGVPESDAYDIASQFWNSDDNSNTDTGGTANTGTEFTPNGGTALWFAPTTAQPTLNNTPGTLTIYFGE